MVKNVVGMVVVFLNDRCLGFGVMVCVCVLICVVNDVGVKLSIVLFGVNFVIVLFIWMMWFDNFMLIVVFVKLVLIVLLDRSFIVYIMLWKFRLVVIGLIFILLLFSVFFGSVNYLRLCNEFGVLNVSIDVCVSVLLLCVVVCVVVSMCGISCLCVFNMIFFLIVVLVSL